MSEPITQHEVALGKLREPFGAEHVGLLPRITCRDCSEASGRCCAQHEKKKCKDCGNYLTTQHMHLDYVGHGAVTDRLLEVDPGWNWEPLATDERGLPLMVADAKGHPVELWIKLTVCGVTRLGVGTCPAGQFDAAKVLIGDALRNAAMRFGVALDLWIKGHGEDDEKTTATDTRVAPSRVAIPDPGASEDQVFAMEAWLQEADEAGQEELRAWWKAQRLPELERLTEDQARRVLHRMNEISVPGAPVPGMDAAGLDATTESTRNGPDGTARVDDRGQGTSSSAALPASGSLEQTP